MFVINLVFSNWWLSKEVGKGINITGLRAVKISATLDPPERVIIRCAFLNFSKISSKKLSIKNSIWWLLYIRLTLLMSFLPTCCVIYIFSLNSLGREHIIAVTCSEKKLAPRLPPTIKISNLCVLFGAE